MAATVKRYQGRRMGRIVIMVFAGLLLSSSAFSFPDNLHGNLHVTGIRSEQDTTESESVNQEYALNWSKEITPLIQLRSGLRYNRLGIDRTLSGNAWRERFRPSADLIWNHPYFSFTSSWMRQETNSSNELTDLVRNNLSFHVQSRLHEYPIVSLRYDRDRTYNDAELLQDDTLTQAGLRRARDTRERRWQLSADHTYRRHQLRYSFTSRDTDNRATGIEFSDISHLFQWQRVTQLFDDKVRISGNYNFSYRQSSTEVGEEGTFDPLNVVDALYSADASPEISTLERRSSLDDGDVQTPAQPLINLGELQIDHNLGVDFGFEREVTGMYIYTNGPSGDNVTWQVYTSNDNISWTRVTAPVQTVFNSSFNRYELTFATVRARYIKAVSGGINEFSEVFVTEVEPVRFVSGEETETMSQTSHLADVATTYFVSDKVTTAFDVSYQREPSGDFSTSRDQLYYSASLTHEPWATVTQVFKYQAGFEEFAQSGIRNEDRNLFYTLLYEPLSTLDFSLSATSRTNYINDARSTEINNVFLQTNGNVLDALNVSAEAGYSRTNRFDSGNRFDTWTYRTSGDAAVFRSLTATLSYLYQTSDDIASDSSRVREQYSVSGTWRTTRTILIRGQYTVNNDQDLQNTYQEYSVNWNASRKINLGALYTLIRTDDGSRSERYNARFNYSVSNRTTIFFNYNSTEFSLGDRPRVDSFELGIRSGF